MSLHFKPNHLLKSNSIRGGRPVFFEVKPKNDSFANGHMVSRPRKQVIMPAVGPRESFNDFINNNAPVEDVIYQSAKPVFTVLRVLGVLPITRPLPGLTQFKLASAAMAYSLFCFGLIVAYVCWVAMNRVKIVMELEGRFEEAVIAYLFLVNLLPIIIIPLMWYETRKIAHLMNDWTDFEILYRKISNRKLPINLKRRALVISVLLPTLSSISVIVTHVTMVEFHVAQVVPYCLLDSITYLLGGYWYLLCEMLSSAANVLADDFQTALRHIGPAAMVADFRSLWLRLSKLSRDTGSSNSYTFTFINLYLFFIITLSIYGLMSQLSEGFGIKDIGLAVTTFSSVGLLFFICDLAHHSAHNIRTNFQKKLLLTELSWMNVDAQTEINMFLRATEMNPSNINLGGYFDVNRNLFKSLMTTMVTYLVVLLQFQISIPDEVPGPQSQNNSTLNGN